MAICKYFQQGNCRFGNNCRYEHIYASGGYNTGGTSVLRNRSISGQQYTSNYFGQNAGTVRSNVNQGELIQLVISELNQSEQGGQWPLSCFAPFKEQSCFPGLEDHSPEELRWLMYQTIQTGGNVDDCKRQLQELYNRNKLQKHALMNPNAETYSLIEKLSKGEKLDNSLTQFSTRENMNNFPSGENACVPATPVSSPFTFSLSQLNSGPTFGESGQAFGSPVQSVSHTNSVFGSSFQSGTTPTNTNIFGGANQIVAGPESRSIFGNPVQSSAIDITSPFNNPSRSVFGTSSHWNQSENQLQDNSVYTPMTELSDEERNIFNLKIFSMGKIPTRPPPKELCG